MARPPCPDQSSLKAHYRALSEALAEAHVKELAALSDEEALRRLLALELFEERQRDPRETTGLVEQQRLFRLGARR